ncbi:hypothetical protein L593_09610 [Salinarchaeum sp. Harcht-Bsk1]|uniref:helicase HerA domain-containing protein n=1 Tax=Salinarchaeum sp. Harcht-Bsk1 TaxID=1333523 RepID=UPI000342312E|nr:DUF87 domain-containing protein [Salinarchaeum sp. Harcht-Bsk1]AGN01867.1 hypothetical protein L593_09610 [Salinarchaeum sp. Harcht-Bsk1]
MAQGSNAEWIVPTTDARSLPVVELLTGRGFVSGKSGSGKSNTVGVIAEELLENGYNFLIVDTEGEYYGLQEQYQLLHVGGDEFADVQVGPNHAEKLAEIGLERNVPIILDVSGFDDVDESRELITRTIEELFRREKKIRKPFLLVVEEMQEYLPQQGSAGELGEILERVAKRGRKRGLGMCGVSQRPSSVDKDFITQCDWMAWHRLTWEADVKVVSKIIGSDRKQALTDLDPGEAFLLTDWDDTIERVQFRRKHTHDAGATPGLESYDRPDLKTVGTELINEIESSEQTKAEAEANARQDDLQPETGSLEDLTIPEDTSDPAPADAAEDGSASASDSAEPPGPPMETQPIEVDEDDPDEAVQRLQQRNRILEREVEELRTLLQSIEPDHERAADHADQPEFATAADGDGGLDADSSPGGTDTKRAPPAPAPAGGSPSPSGSASASPSSKASSPTPTAPSRPMPPERPSNRSGLAGVILEFGEMIIYLLKSTSYRFRLAWFKLRQKLA